MFGEPAIGEHLLDNPMCVKNYSDKKFTILSFGRSSFHLFALEVVYIESRKPNLCRQKEFVYNLKILRSSSLSSFGKAFTPDQTQTELGPLALSCADHAF